MNSNIFDKYVGIEGHTSIVAPDKVNSLPNITPEIVNFVKLEYGGTVDTLWDKVAETATEIISNEFTKQICKKANYNPLLQVTETPVIPSDSVEYVCDGTKYVGVEINCNKAREASLLIDSFCIDSDYNGTANIEIFNIQSGTGVLSKTHTFTAGAEIISLGLAKLGITFGQGKYFVGVAFPSGIKLKSLGVNTGGDSVQVTSGFVLVSDSKVSTNVKNDSTFYASVLLELTHDFTDVIKRNAEQLALAFKYYAGADILFRLQSSKKANVVTLVNRDILTEQIKDLTEKGDYALKNVADIAYRQLMKIPNAIITDPNTKQGNFLSSFV